MDVYLILLIQKNSSASNSANGKDKSKIYLKNLIILHPLSCKNVPNFLWGPTYMQLFSSLICVWNMILRLSLHDDCNVIHRKTIMKNAVKDTKALVVVSQDQMLEKLQHSEVRGHTSSWQGQGGNVMIILKMPRPSQPLRINLPLKFDYRYLWLF